MLYHGRAINAESKHHYEKCLISFLSFFLHNFFLPISKFDLYLITSRAFSFVSNTFNFVFRFDDTVSLRRVLPSNREEAVVLVRRVIKFKCRCTVFMCSQLNFGHNLNLLNLMNPILDFFYDTVSVRE